MPRTAVDAPEPSDPIGEAMNAARDHMDRAARSRLDRKPLLLDQRLLTMIELDEAEKALALAKKLAVREAREAGHTWGEIGAVLVIPRDQAFKAFADEIDGGLGTAGPTV